MQQFSSAVNNHSGNSSNSSNNHYHNNYNNNNNNNNNNSNTFISNAILHSQSKMHSLDLNVSHNSDVPSPVSPPDFDFSMPCGYFKSSFARSLSLNNANNHNHWKSLDFDINNRSSNNDSSSNHVVAQKLCPPLPSRSSRAGTPANPADNSYNKLTKNEVSRCSDDAKPPAIPARRPVPTAFELTRNAQTHHKQQHQQQHQQQQQQQQQQSLTQFRHVAAVAAAASSLLSSSSSLSLTSSSSVGNNAGNLNAVAAHGNFNKVINHAPQQQQQQQHQLNNIGSRSSSNFRRNLVWPRDNAEQDSNLSDEVEQNAVPVPTKISRGEAGGAPFQVQHENSNTLNVEAVILQNQVDTLEWQLKQVETSREMYRAVMEEVARFLDRYHSQRQQLRQLQQLQQQQQQNRMEQISRSKSLYHVYGGAGGGGHEKNNPQSGDEATPATYLRARSSTNLIEPPSLALLLSKKSSAKDRKLEVTAPAENSYSAFKDYTWRRSPKNLNELRAGITSTDNIEDKLNQDAFRLSRTIHNLLNTSIQQPDLTQHRTSLAAVSSLGRLGKTPSSSTMTLNSILSATSNVKKQQQPTAVSSSTPKNKSLANAAASEVHFLRSAKNIRDSRLSLRSSTDSSMHSTISSAASSTSSSKVETDEEGHYHSSPTLTSAGNGNGNGSKQKTLQQTQQLGSTTEDESGFSSISSFQDIGVPLSSTLLSNVAPPDGRLSLATIALTHTVATTANSDTAVYASHEFQLDSRNSTLKAITPTTPTTPTTSTTPATPAIAIANVSSVVDQSNNEVGVPLNVAPDMQHRWDSPSRTSYRSANKYQRFSTLSKKESGNVLWV